MPLWLTFAAQLLVALTAFIAGPFIARRSRPVWFTTCILALLVLLLWPLVRFFPAAPIQLLGAQTVATVELTALFIPATLLLTIAAQHIPKASDRRAILLLIGVAGIYFVRAGWWMISAGVPNLGPTLIESGICRQSTGYTCVAASMVTMLRAHNIEATETEMARLAHIQVNGGATDSRAVWALEQKLTDHPFTPVYRTLDLPGLIAAPKPLLVQLDWGFFVSHMVPVMSADQQTVTIGDPLTGPRTLSLTDFAARWKRHAIMLVPVN